MPEVSATDDRLARVHQKLTDAVAELVRSEAWLRMLTVAARFPQYSPSNVLLISMQKPDASRLGGIRLWNSLGRRVRKGEKGIAILAPCLYKSKADKDGPAPPSPRTPGDDGAPDHLALRGFRVVHVFDVTQTEGESLPEVSPSLLTGPAPERLWDSLATLAARDSYVLERGDCGGANGLTNFDHRVIRIRDDVETSQAAKTLAHELGHVRADHESRFMRQYGSAPCRGVAEVEAESIAFLVAASAGLDSSAYAVPYVAGWAGGDVGLLKTTASRVLVVARGIVYDAGFALEPPPTPGTEVGRPNIGPSTPIQLSAGTERTLSW